MVTTASTPNWRIAYMSALPGQFWVKMATPGANALASIHTDGTPDATLNTTAQHLGGTEAGSKVMVKPTFQNFEIDEFRNPVITTIGGMQMGISANLAAVNDTNLLAWLLNGIGTRTVTSNVTEQIKIGITALTYYSCVLIFPLQLDQTKFGIFHVYNGLNNAGVEWDVTRKKAGFTPINLLGFELTTRAVTDTMGAIWTQNATTTANWS